MTKLTNIWQSQLWRGIPAIPYVDDMAREGRAFTAHVGGQTAGTVDVLLDSGPEGTGDVWMVHEAFIAVDGEFSLYEDVAVSDNGTPRAIFDHNRIGPGLSTLALHTGPTVTDTGVPLINAQFMAGGVNRGISVASGATGVDFWIVRPNTLYLLRLTNLAGGTERWSMTFNFIQDKFKSVAP